MPATIVIAYTNGKTFSGTMSTPELANKFADDMRTFKSVSDVFVETIIVTEQRCGICEERTLFAGEQWAEMVPEYVEGIEPSIVHPDCGLDAGWVIA